MYRITELTGALPKMLSGDALAAAMTVLPDYDESIRREEVPVRLMALNDLYGIYLPSQMSFEIYSKLYLGLMRSLQKKGTKLAIQQRNQNHRAVIGQEYGGILGGSDSFTIIGTSGIGKSSAIGRAMELIGANGILETGEPHSCIIPCLTVQTPFDCSVKGLLLEMESIIHPYSSPEARGAELVRQFLEQTKLETYTMDELNPLLQDLVKVFGRPSRSSAQGNGISSPNYYLHKAGYQSKRLNNNSKHPNYNKYRIEIWND